MALKMIKISQISPLMDSTAKNSLVLPLNFFELRWLSFHPTQQVIFYKLSDLCNEFFYSVILPKLERSLSIVLGYYLPLVGHLTWDPQDPKPCIVVHPHDTVSMTVAESSRDVDFSSVSSKWLRPAKEIRPYVPELPVAGDSPSLLALQVTFFPNQGFSIGIVSHHAFMDAITAQLFIKSWAHISKHETMSLLKDLTPVLDRNAINVPACLEAKMLESLPYMSKDNKDNNNVRALKLPPTKEIDDDLYRVTLELTSENVDHLKKKAKNESTRGLHLSTYVVVNAYLWTCLVKARGGDDVDTPVAYEYAADFRKRLDPHAPETYSGACVFVISCLGHKAKTFLGDDGFVNAVEIVSDSVKGLGSKRIEVLFELFVERMRNLEEGTDVWGAAGSNRFSVYGCDFGWGKPVSSEIVSIDQSQIFSISGRRDEPGGVEIGLCLKKSEMDVFVSLFKNGF